MTEDRVIALVAILGALMLVGSGVVRRAMRGEQVGRMALLWIGIMVVAWAVATVALRR